MRPFNSTRGRRYRLAITWVVPQTGEVFGPGFRVSLFSTAVGPFETGSYWEIELTAPANENVVGTRQTPYVSNTLDVLTWWHGNDDQMEAIHPIPAFASGEPGQLKVSLVQPTFGVADTSSIPIVMDMQTGQTEEIRQLLGQIVPAAGQGLTQEEHDSLVITQMGVTAGFGLDPLSLVGDLVQAIGSSNPLGYGSLQEPAQCVTGDGEFDDLDPLLPKWGMYWIASVIPPELGHRHGQSEEYPSRLVQLRTVHEVGGVEMVTEIVNATTHGELWRFRFQRPLRVEYSVLPGVTICASWWQFP